MKREACILPTKKEQIEKTCEICESGPRIARYLLEHIEFMDQHIPEWLDVEWDGSCTMVQIPERTTRLLRTIKETELLQKCLDAIRELSVTRKDPFTGLFVEHPMSYRMIKRSIAKVHREHEKRRITPEYIPLVNVWNFNVCDTRYGIVGYPGRTPGQIVVAALYYWSEPRALVVDPFAGGGTTLDVCRIHGYRCLAYDIAPARPEIQQHDIREGFPAEAQGCDFIYLDPPYWNLKVKEYHEESISSLSYADFIKFMSKLAGYCRDTLAPSGIVALLIQDKLGTPFNDQYYPTSIDSFNAFRLQLKPISRVLTPLGETPQLEVFRPYRDAKQMVGIARDLWIFQKEGDGR